MKIILTGGGTGGHIYPALAIADKIKDEHPDSEILFVGTEKGLEKILAPQRGYPIRFISVRGFNRKQLLKNVSVIAELMEGIKEARSIIKEFKPDIVIGTGGYVCGPVVKAAADLGIRTYIHEQNVTPGLTNRLLERRAEKVFVGFEEAKRNFKQHDKIVVSGNPVRKDFYCIDKKTARLGLDIAEESFVALSLGGSRGAAKINAVMTEVAAALSGVANTELFFVTGNIHYDETLNAVKEKGVVPEGNIHVLPYLEDMHRYLSACDIVISRAGAITISEIMVCGKPAILIPSPNVTGNHQYFNAKALADKGGAIIIEEKELNSEKLIDEILKIKGVKKYSDKMATLSRNSITDSAVEIIYENLGLTTAEEEKKA